MSINVRNEIVHHIRKAACLIYDHIIGSAIPLFGTCNNTEEEVSTDYLASTQCLYM